MTDMDGGAGTTPAPPFSSNCVDRFVAARPEWIGGSPTPFPV